MQLTKTAIRTQSVKIYASAHITRYPLLQQEQTDLAKIYGDLQSNLKDKKSVKSAFEMNPDFDWELANQKKLAELKKIGEKQPSEDGAESAESGDDERFAGKKINDVIHYSTAPLEWNGLDSILDMAKKSVENDPQFNDSKAIELLSWPSSVPIAVDTENISGEQKVTKKIFHLQAYLECEFNDLADIEFDNWCEESKLAV